MGGVRDRRDSGCLLLGQGALEERQGGGRGKG